VIKPQKTEAEMLERREYKKEIRLLARNPDLVKFPKEIQKELETISENIPQDEIKKRRDFRNDTTMTIDPDDAKDFDDALSVVIHKDGSREIGIHIADVGYYVREKTKVRSKKRTNVVHLFTSPIPSFQCFQKLFQMMSVVSVKKSTVSVSVSS
jgi:exoribonuclease R